MGPVCERRCDAPHNGAVALPQCHMLNTRKTCYQCKDRQHQAIKNKSQSSHQNVTCDSLNFRATRLHEAQTFIRHSWVRLYHKRAKPRRRLGKRRSSYRQEDSKKTSTASRSNRCERRYGSRKINRALPRG